MAPIPPIATSRTYVRPHLFIQSDCFQIRSAVDSSTLAESLSPPSEFVSKFYAIILFMKEINCSSCIMRYVYFKIVTYRTIYRAANFCSLFHPTVSFQLLVFSFHLVLGTFSCFTRLVNRVKGFRHILSFCDFVIWKIK